MKLPQHWQFNRKRALYERCDKGVVYGVVPHDWRKGSWVAYGPMDLIGNYTILEGAMKTIEEKYPLKECRCTNAQVLSWEIQQALENQDG